jgi:GT2 family glycosyltransferase
MNLSIIIPNYNGEKILKENLPKVLAAVKEYKEGKVEIIIPDDPSTDNSEEVIHNFIANIQLKHVIGKTCTNKDPKKAGFSKNVNRGVKLATGDILILFNSDVTPHQDFLESLLPHFKKEEVFAVACMDESIEDNKVVLRGRGVGRWERGFLHHSEGKLDKSDTLWASGGSSAFRKSIWDKIGGLEELFNPFYWEDIDLSYRAWKSGYIVVFEPKSKVVHKHEEGSIKKNITSAKVIKTAYRNQCTFVWLNITDTDLLLSHLLWLPYHMLKAVIKGDWLFLQGVLQACQRLPQILKKRKKYKRHFIRTDKEILHSLQS